MAGCRGCCWCASRSSFSASSSSPRPARRVARLALRHEELVVELEGAPVLALGVHRPPQGGVEVPQVEGPRWQVGGVPLPLDLLGQRRGVGPPCGVRERRDGGPASRAAAWSADRADRVLEQAARGAGPVRPGRPGAPRGRHPDQRLGVGERRLERP